MGSCWTWPFDTDVPEAPAPPPAPAPPGKDASTIALEQKQLELMELADQRERQRIAQEDATQKAYEEALGMPLPKYVAQTAKTQGDLAQMYIDRYKKGLAGELPVDPGLERSLTENEATLREKLRSQGLEETSTPAIQSLAELRKRNEELRYAARRGEISAGEQQGYAASPLTYAPKLFASPTVNTPTGLNELWQKYQADRALRGQYSLAGYQGDLVGYNASLNQRNKQAEQQMQLFSSLMGMGGQIGGAATHALLI
jgi:hypothetical protein